MSALYSQKVVIPRILVIDLDISVTSFLRDLGYNITIGTFGKPLLGKDGSPLVLNGFIPADPVDYHIIIVDLLNSNQEKIEKELKKKKESSPDFRILNPQFLFSSKLKPSFTRAIIKGGCIVCFADMKQVEASARIKKNGKMIFAGYMQKKYSVNYELYEEVDNYDWIPFDISLSNHGGIMINFSNSEFRDFFRSLDGSLRWTCSFSEFGLNYYIRKGYDIYDNEIKFTVLATNNFDVPVALKCKLKNGFFILLPQTTKKTEAIRLLLDEILPLLTPDIFPERQVFSWLNKKEYRFESESKLENEKTKLKKEYRKKYDEVDTKIQKLNQELKPFKQLIVADDENFEDEDKLSACVKYTLNYLEFKKVIDMDEIAEKEGKQKEEDFHVIDDSFYAIVECKGTSKSAIPDEYYGDLIKYLNRRKTDLSNSSLSGILIVNHHRYKEPMMRTETFKPETINDAKRDGVGLLSTFNLYKAIRLEKKGKITKSQIREIMNKKGKIEFLI